ncbi:M28 family peptidase [Salmonirosea aquatica]|uniref:Carboxypeptidase Q n=1 Tax=Salmonirosea aquatica TaxID=2654236 RepID=A0A7C9BG31_9BACT|nr:M28 family peptidase [Cytophagaceae bacterium SJW1-29]
MKKTLLIALAGSTLVGAAAFAPSADDLEATFARIDAEVRQHSRVYATLQDATQKIGHRLTGSTHGMEAETYAFNTLKSYGFSDVKYQPFEVESWSRDTVTLSIVPESSDNFREVPVVSLAHSPVISDLRAGIVDVGNGLEEDFEQVKDKIKGKVAVANIGLVGVTGKKNLHRSEKTALAIKYGAGGIIMVNQAPGKILLTGTASVTGALIAIPAVCISNDSGRELRSWLKEEGPLEAHVNMRNFSKPIKARNVIATLKGKTDERVIVGGHLDSWDLATGAIDNGIGSFSVLDMARTFKALKIKPYRTIQFVMFMGEEQGLLGSKHMVKELARTGEISQVSYMMNLDMTNDPKGANAFGRADMEDFFQKIGAGIKKVDPSFENKLSNRAGLHSDHQPFMLEGVPVAGLSGSLSPSVLQCYHADCDRFDLVDKQQLENTVRIGSMYLYALANAKKLPAKRLDSMQTRDYLTTQGLKEELVLGQDWRW